MADAVAVANVLGSVVLGNVTADFGRAVASNPVGAPSFPENRGGESTLGNLVADVQRWALNADGTRDVDIAFMNPGGLRADLPRRRDGRPTRRRPTSSRSPTRS